MSSELNEMSNHNEMPSRAWSSIRNHPDFVNQVLDRLDDYTLLPGKRYCLIMHCYTSIFELTF